MSSQMLLLQESNFVWYLVMQWQFINHSGLDLIMLCDLNRATHTGKKKTVPVVKGYFYTTQSCAKERENVKLISFRPDIILPSKPALDKMQKIRNESLFTWQHPLKVSGNRMTLFNNRCCDAHIKHLLSDNM